jgi:hypothetical protein
MESYPVSSWFDPFFFAVQENFNWHIEAFDTVIQRKPRVLLKKYSNVGILVSLKYWLKKGLNPSQQRTLK